MGRYWKPYRTSIHNPVIQSYQPTLDQALEGKRPSGFPWNPFDCQPGKLNPDPWDPHIVIYSNSKPVRVVPLEGSRVKFVTLKNKAYRPGVPLGHPTLMLLPHFFSKKEQRWLDSPLHPNEYKGTAKQHNNNPVRRVAKIALAAYLFFPTRPARGEEELKQEVGREGAWIRDPRHNPYYADYLERGGWITSRGYVPTNKQKHRVKLHSRDYRQCEGRSRQTGQRCRRRALIGDRYCVSHTNRKMWVDVMAGRYSAYLPRDLASRLEELISDPEILNLSAELGLTTIRIESLLRAIKNHEAGYSVFKQLRELWQEYTLASRDHSNSSLAQSSGAADSLLSRIGRVIEEGAHEGSVWTDITVQIEQRRKLAESEGRRLERMQQMIPTDRVLILVDFITNSVKKALNDNVANNAALPAFEANDATERALEQIATDIRYAISGESGGQPLAPSYIKPPTVREQLGDVAPHAVSKVPHQTGRPNKT